MELFILTSACKSGIKCDMCRSKDAGRHWRKSMGEHFEMPSGHPDFECPYGKEWKNKKDELFYREPTEFDKNQNINVPNISHTRNGPPNILNAIDDKIKNKPLLPNFKQIKTFAQAMVNGKYVSKDIVEKRMEICNSCDKQKITDQGIKWCGLCGCNISSEDKVINNLAAYEEDLPNHGCKFPTGSKWKAAGL